MSWIKVFSLSISCLVLVDCLPTSVLVDSKASALKSGDVGGEKLLEADGLSSSSSTKSAPKKRGAVLPELPQLEFLPRGDLYLLNQNQPESLATGGSWGDDGQVGGGLGGGYFERGDPAATRGFYDSFYGYSPYENIQDLINSREEEFSEPVAMPLVYPVPPRGEDTGFYGISRNNNGYRRKRSNKVSKAYRLKRESDRINAAEALALLELIEAQESARHRPKDDYWYNKYATNDEANDDGLWLDSWTEPNARYFAVPQPTINYSPYDSSSSYGPSKRFMVAKKKKRSLVDTHDWRMGMKSNQRMLLTPHASVSKFEQNGRHSFPELAGFKPNQKISQ